MRQLFTFYEALLQSGIKEKNNEIMQQGIRKIQILAVGIAVYSEFCSLNEVAVSSFVSILHFLLQLQERDINAELE